MKKRYMILHFKSTVMNNWKVQKVRRLQPLHSHPETRIKEASSAKNMFNKILTRIWSENPLWLGICMKRIMKREWSEHPVQLENDNTPKTKTILAQFFLSVKFNIKNDVFVNVAV